MVRLKNYLEKWVLLSESKDAMELFLIEQFIDMCPPEVAAYLKQSKINNLEAVAESADRYLIARGKKLSVQKRVPTKYPSTDLSCLICK